MEIDTGGASRFWTSDEPVVLAARADVAAGRLGDAEARLRAMSGSVAADEGLQVIAWIRRDYSLSDAELLEKLRPAIPGVRSEDLARWRDRGELQHRAIDGRPCTFRSEPANLFRFCDEAKCRRIDAIPPADWKLEDHLARVVAAVKPSGHAAVVPIRQELDFELVLPAGLPELTAGAVVRAWLPFPKNVGQQTDARLIAASPATAFVAPEASPQRSVYLEHRVSAAGEAVRFAATVGFTTSAWCPLLAGATAGDRPSPQDLAERPPHVMFTPAVRAAVAAAVGDATSPLEKARRIFHWVCGNIAYNAEEEYGIIPSLPERALERGRGDCGVMAMLLIAMCRCAGIPARWQSGWQTQRVRWNMHDWCEIFAEPVGWMPVDPSYGLRQSDDPRVREFYFGGIDAYRMIVNTDYGKPLCPPKQSLRSEPLDFQRGEVEVNGRNLYFDRWQWTARPRAMDEGP